MTEARAERLIWRCPDWCVFYTSSYPQGHCVMCGKQEVLFDPADPIYRAHQAEVRASRYRAFDWLACPDLMTDADLTELFRQHPIDVTREGSFTDD